MHANTVVGDARHCRYGDVGDGWMSLGSPSTLKEAVAVGFPEASSDCTESWCVRNILIAVLIVSLCAA